MMRKLLVICTAAVAFTASAAELSEAEVDRLCPPRAETAAAFKAGAYPPAARPYREAALKAFAYMASLPAMRTLVEKGEPEQTYQHNAYVSKTHAAHINLMLEWARREPARRAEAMRFVKASAEYLLTQLEPKDAPLAWWPPTYGRKPLRRDPSDGGKNRPSMVGNEPEGAVKYRGEVMLLYPADVGTAFVAYYRETHDRRFLDAACGIGETYLKIRRPDGSWPLKMRLATGKPIGENTLVPTKPLAFFNALAKATGDDRWTKASDACFAWLEAHPLTDWNWDGQFEDIQPRPPYANPTKHNAVDAMFEILRRFPGDKARLEQCRRILRFCEKRFVCWERPANHPQWDAPSVLEQYSCFVPIDSSAAKMIRAYLALWRATGEPELLAKARTLGDTITRVQTPEGRIPTFWTHNTLGEPIYDWLNCMGSSAAALLELADATDSPVKGTMGQPLLVCGAGRAFLVAPDGRVTWNKSGCGNIHRVWKHGEWVYYSNGDLRRIDILSGKDELLYRPCEKEGVFGFEVLKNGNIVVAENGTGFIAELKAGSWEPVVRFKGDPTAPDGTVPGGVHHRYRMIRKTDKGTYLVCCSSANYVREYDMTGKLVWEQKIPAKLTFDCLRRANGNTLVSHLDAVTEYSPDHQVVWQFTCADAPELKLANLCGIWEQKNGNLVVGTYANGVEDGSRTTAFEVTRGKKIVWSYAAAGKRFSMMTAFPVAPSQWPVACVSVPQADEAKMEEIVGTRLSATPRKPRKVLMVARAFGYCHNDAMAYGRRAFEIAAGKTGAFALDFTEDVSVLGDDAALARYDAVVINNATMISVKRFPSIETALVAYVKGGRGLCLIHAAVDSFYDSPVVADMNGGLFWGHPWMAGGTWRFRNEEPAHPLTAMFEGKATFTSSDEIYMHSSPAYSRDKDRVLISIDLSDGATAAAADRWAKSRGADKLRADRDFAVSWTRRYGAGRVFYTSFGHDKRAFIDKPRLLHMLTGLQYCLGDLDCPDSPL